MSRACAILCCLTTLSVSGVVSGALYEVGPGQTYATIGSAVSAAAAADSGASASNTPNSSPVTIRVHAGTYVENVLVPADPSGAFNGLNDGWTIESAPGATVWLHGGIGVGQGRDNGVIDGIHIKQSAGTGAAYAFTASGNTARAWQVRNGVVYSDGTSTSPGFAGNLMYGAVNLDHMTFFGNLVGVSNGYASAGSVTNSIFVNATSVAIAANNSYSAAKTVYSNSLFFGNAANATGPSVQDGGNNILAAPAFASTDPSSPEFLMLSPDSPGIGQATSQGRWQDGNHLGALGVAAVPEPASGISVVVAAGLMMLRRRRVHV
jgi:hypothetical protein